MQPDYHYSESFRLVALRPYVSISLPIILLLLGTIILDLVNLSLYF